MRNLLTICVCVLLVCALTTSLIGSTSPSFEVVLQKCSDIELNLEVLFATIEEVEYSYLEYQDISALEGIDKILGMLKNFLAEVVNAIIGVFSFVVNAVIIIESALQVFFVFIEIGVYLLFGIEFELPDRLKDSLI